jgi:nucleotide-binding universal stress UspA family protein
VLATSRAGSCAPSDVTKQLPRLKTVGTAPRGDSRPILLATFFSVPFHHGASEFAVDSAVEGGQPLIVANVVELPPLPMSVRLGYDHLDDPPDIESALRAPVELAHSLGVQVERLLVRSPRPVTALLQLTAERRPGLLVLGSDPARLSRRFFRRVWRTVREDASCLVWRAMDDYEPPACGEAGASD